MNSFSFAALTDVGTVRTNNEDSALASCELLALADGMGGHAAGEVASAVVMHSLSRLLAPGAEITVDAVTEAARTARGALRSMSQADHEMEGMGTTLVGLGVGPDGVILTHVGDSRIYRVRDGEVVQITTDHTHVQRLVDSGRLDPAEVRNHPYRSVILRSIDDTSDDLPDVSVTDEIRAGDRVLLCSDGLSDYVTHEALVTSLVDGSPLDAARSLLRGALRAGTRDNVTVIVADVHDPDLEQNDDVVPEPAVVVGASLGQAQLDGSARAVLLDAFPDAATLLDTVPRVPADEIDEDTLPPRGGAAARSTAAAGDGVAPVPPAVPGGGGVALADGPDVTETVPFATARDVTETVPVPPPVVATGEEAEVGTAGATEGEGLEALFGPGAAADATSTASPVADERATDDDGAAAPPAPRPSHRPDARDVLWLGLVVASFTAVTLSVWFTQS
ncbi:PP2C family protein-serine/threonine phosphatase [Serinibacter arcticus]|uniref:Serine/threonine phosphatase PPP n=1 Tax=Serinibacter arcticus TaxID=1655435 RepID=A0A4Z1E2G0_9MICO|nr:protein phosphatase 2C domain-containing protein [Serinibacter arcticus]TGO03831.1 Serine/threonine phosphatase PPP [Serinibacter arcticus]